MKIKKYVVIFCKKDDKEKFITKNFLGHPPYGFHHIVGIYPDGSYWVVGMIQGETSEKAVLDITRVLASGLPFEVDSDFYLKIMKERSG